MKRYICTTNKRGSISFIALMITLVMMTVAILFNWYVREQLLFYEVLKKKSEAVLKNRSMVHLLIYSMVNGKFHPDRVELKKIDSVNEFKSNEIFLDGREYLIDNDTIFSIQDTNGKFSIVDFDPVLFGRLIKKLTGEENLTIINSILDWIDKDEYKRVNGYEKTDAMFEGKGYYPRNYPIQFKEELKLINGMNEDIYKKLEKYITELPSTGFNPNTASADLLMVYLDVDNDTATNLKNYIMKNGPIRNDTNLLSQSKKNIFNPIAENFMPSYIFELRMENRDDNKTIYSTFTGISLRLNNFSPYSIFVWRED